MDTVTRYRFGYDGYDDPIVSCHHIHSSPTAVAPKAKHPLDEKVLTFSGYRGCFNFSLYQTGHCEFTYSVPVPPMRTICTPRDVTAPFPPLRPQVLRPCALSLCIRKPKSVFAQTHHPLSLTGAKKAVIIGTITELSFALSGVLPDREPQKPRGTRIRCTQPEHGDGQRGGASS